MKRVLILFLLTVVTARGGTVRVEPAVELVPANHLKCYLHFPAPMERGEAFRFLRLVEIDGQGNEVAEIPEPFREIELWDETFARMTLWFHPGRQKPGVNLNVEIGPILEEGKRYRLEIAGTWCDESGNPLGETLRHEFVAGAIDETQPDPNGWKISVKEGFVRVDTGESLDPESVRRRITVRRGEEILSTELEVDAEGFTIRPKESLVAGRHTLVIDPRLEDLAGNSLERPFNRDLDQGEGGDSKEEVKRDFVVPAAR